MSKLAAALAWASRGFAVFPLKENTREPAFHGNWLDSATTDPEIIRAIWTDSVTKQERNYNIGCVTTDYVVVDVDVKKGKDGYNQYMKLGGHFDTLTVQTTSGGFHCYFYGPDSRGSLDLANGVDIRSHHNYVVAPGSVINGVPYAVINDRDMVWVPESIERVLERPYVRAASAENITHDTPAMIEAGRAYLETAPVAVEGLRGDEITFVTAARLVREMALSVQTAFELMRDHWNDRCSPPWDQGDLYKKVENAYQYGTAIEGRVTPEVLYESVGELASPQSVFEQLAPVQQESTFGNGMLASAISKRPVLVERLLTRRAVTLMIAPGSAGKSSLSLALAAHLAVGISFAGLNVTEACRTVVYNGEDDLEEQSRRLIAVCTEYGIDYDRVRPSILMLSSRDMKIKLVTKEGNRAVKNDIIITQIKEFLTQNKVGMMVLDPLVRIHECDESDNAAMDVVMDAITDIGHDANVAMLLLHHTSKVNLRQDERAGNPDMSRGATSIVNAARIAVTLGNATLQDSEEYGIPPEEINRYVRMDDAKMNMSLASRDATWFVRGGVKMAFTGDSVGVLKYHKLTKSEDHMRQRNARMVADEMLKKNTASFTLTEVVALLQQNEPVYRNRKQQEVRGFVIRHFGSPGTTLEDGRTITLMKDDGDNPIVRLS